jgi:predicted enzyme related to lactoylglutathione lyase
LGVSRLPQDYAGKSWHQLAGPTAFAPFPADTDYFGSPAQSWMLNFRVQELDRLVAELREQGIEVTIDPESYPNGLFARLRDPEGNPIELWEPKTSG